MGQIFQAAQSSTYSYTAGGAIITWGQGGGASGMLPIMMTQLTIQYTRPISPQFPINVTESGVNTSLNIMGRPSGTLQCTGLLAPNATSLSGFLEATGKACVMPGEGVSVGVRPFTLCDTDTPMTFTLKDVILQNVSVTIQGGEVQVVQVPLTFLFTSMDVG